MASAPGFVGPGFIALGEAPQAVKAVIADRLAVRAARFETKFRWSRRLGAKGRKYTSFIWTSIDKFWVGSLSGRFPGQRLARTNPVGHHWPKRCLRVAAPGTEDEISASTL